MSNKDTYKTGFFYDVAPCILVDWYKYFEEYLRLSLQDKTVNMEVACYSEKYVPTYQSTRCHIREKPNLVLLYTALQFPLFEVQCSILNRTACESGRVGVSVQQVQECEVAGSGLSFHVARSLAP
jgi:hypothetical protein